MKRSEKAEEMREKMGFWGVLFLGIFFFFFTGEMVGTTKSRAKTRCREALSRRTAKRRRLFNLRWDFAGKS